MKLMYLAMLLDLVGRCCGQTKIKIGALVAAPNSEEEIAFMQAISDINNNSKFLPGFQLEAAIRYTPLLDGFMAMKGVCELLKEGVASIVGPITSTNVKAAQPLAASYAIPSVVPVATDPLLNNKNWYPYLIRMSPSDRVQSQALVDFLRLYRFDTVAILTDNSDYGINGLIEFQTIAAQFQWRVMSTQQFTATAKPEDVNATSQLKNVKNSGARIVILNCVADHALYVLKQAYHLGMMTTGWLWLGTDGITAYDLFPKAVAENEFLNHFIGTLPISNGGSLYQSFFDTWKSNGNPISPNGQISANPGRFYDSVLVIANGLQSVLRKFQTNFTTESFDCFDPAMKEWTFGPALYDAMKSVNTQGVASDLQFAADGSPKSPAYYYFQLEGPEWEIVGNWTVETKSVLENQTWLLTVGNAGDSSRIVDVRDFVANLQNKTVVVATIVEPPFIQYFETKTDAALQGCRSKVKVPARADSKVEQVKCLEGYCIDLLNKLADEMGFTYQLHLVEDKKYGTLTESGWNGLVKELLPDSDGNTKADMVMAPFTISADREKVISFTKPYRDLSMGIIVGYKEETTYNPFSFLVPFETELWIYIVLTAFAIGIFLAIVDKLSPYGHHGKKVQNESEDEFEEMDINEDGTIDEWERRNWIKEKEAMNFHNAIFWSFASFFEQGGEYHPRAWSGRVVAGAWWFGIVIIISTYTANLAAFLTIKTPKDQINNVNQLASQTKVLYTLVDGTEVENFFMGHKGAPYHDMAQQMTNWLNSGEIQLYNTTGNAFNIVQNETGSLALLTDGPLAEYLHGQDCQNTRIIGDGFGSIGYGIGLPLTSLYREELSIKILKFREDGFIDQLDYNWLTKNVQCKKGNQVDSSGQQIELDSMLGVFYVIYVGFGVAFVVLIVEWIVSCVSSIDKEHPRRPNSFYEALKDKMHRLKVDILENWFFCKLSNNEESLQLFAVKRDIPGVRSKSNSRLASHASIHPLGAQSPGNNHRQSSAFQGPANQAFGQKLQQPIYADSLGPPIVNGNGLHKEGQLPGSLWG